ncbi:UPF0220 domain protein [Beauveria brongniartii RCEF 3172]|uniref:UPF0220 domain protein n=1 Tax=Beauveria brongniartii RCEF 3172 TaxID=1081107 RepID=A0A167D2G6_9HYPO|nr:UPF0220 domain protein [Beauveria brongniartii RCEF 3172]
MNERSRTISGSHHHHHHHHPPPLQRARAGTVGTVSAAPYQSSQAPAAPAASRDRLFRSHLIRRPTGGGATSATSASSAAAAATHPDAAALVAAEELQQLQAERCEIVVRNHNGDIDLEGSPVVSLDDIDEMALEARHETEQERQRLAEAVKQHRINHTAVPDQPEELLEAVRASLRAKVNALADDHWMFDPEDPPRG